MTDYDVIVIGNGAGGGTLVNRLAPSGKRILLLERGDWLKREPQNWSAGDVFIDNRYISEDTWYDGETAKRFSPRCTISSAAPPSSTAPLSTASGRRTSASCATTTASPPTWPIGYDEMEPYYTEAEQLYQVHGARGGSHRARRQRALSLPGRVPRAAHPAARRRSRSPRPSALPRALRGVLNEPDMARGACVRCGTCDGFPCLVRQVRRRSARGAPGLEHPNVTLLRAARAGRPPYQPERQRRDRGRGGP